MTDLYDQDAIENLHDPYEFDTDDLPRTMPIEEIPDGANSAILGLSIASEAARLLADAQDGLPAPGERLSDVYALIRYQAATLDAQGFPATSLDASAWMANTLDESEASSPIYDWWEVPAVRRLFAYQTFVQFVFSGDVLHGLGGVANFSEANSAPFDGEVELLSQVEDFLLRAIKVLPGYPDCTPTDRPLEAALARSQDPFEVIS